MDRDQDNLPIRSEALHEDEPVAQVLDPAGAATIQLPPSFKPDKQEYGEWPEGFWDHYNKGDSLYKQGHYQEAKTAFVAARALLSDYVALETALLRTYRKLYKAAIGNERWEDAFRELSELLVALPSAVTDTDRRQFNKVIDQMQSMDPSFPENPFPLKKKGRRKSNEPLATAESVSRLAITIEPDDQWIRPKGEKPPRWFEKHNTSKGFIGLSRGYDREAGGYNSCNIKVFSPEGEFVSEREMAQGFYRVRVSHTGEHLVGYSDDLIMSLWTLSGEKLADRNVRHEAEDSKYSIRCVDLSDDAQRILFTSSTRAYLLDRCLRTLRIMIMPPPEGYEVEYGDHDPEDEQISLALSTLELAGRPTQAEIKTQFRKLALLYHPDRNPDDPASEERMKEIIAAYEMVSEEGVLESLDGLVDSEYYYKVFHEESLEIPGTGLSFTISMSMGGMGDWIYASHMSPNANKIYLGTYSGKTYCINLDGEVLAVFSTDDRIDGILERGSFLYIWTCGSLFVLQNNQVKNHIDLRDSDFEYMDKWGFLVRKGSSLILYEHDGTQLGKVRFTKKPHEVISSRDGFHAYTTKERVRVLVTEM